MPRLEAQPIDYSNMVGGSNTLDSAVRLGVQKFRDAQNVNYFPVGGFSWRKGYAQVNATPLSAVSTGLFAARFSNGTIQPYVVNGSKIYTLNISTGATSDITNGVTISQGNNNLWTFDVLNDLVCLSNGVDTSLQITSNNTVTVLSGSPPFTSALFNIQHRGYMMWGQPVVSGTTQYDRFYFSSINDPTTVGSNNFVDVAKKNAGDLRGAVDYQGSLFLFKRHGIYEVNYQPTRVNSSGVIFPFTEFPNPIVAGVGALSHRSIAKFTTPITHANPGQELVFFVDQFGVPRIFDGRATIQVGRSISDSRDTTITTIASMDKSRTAQTWSVNYPDRNQILCFMSSSGAGNNDTCWVLDYTVGFAWGRHKFALPFNCGALIEKSDGTFRPYFADYVGQVHQYDTGTDDNGTAIVSYATCADAVTASPALRSNWPWIELRGSTGSTTQTVNLNFFKDGDDTSSLVLTPSLAKVQTTWGTTGAGGTMIWGSSPWARTGLITAQPKVGIDAKTLRVKFSNSVKGNSCNIESFSLYAIPEGSSA